MGGCISKPKKRGSLNNTSVQKVKGEVKIILLGAGESGKSTVIRQMRILNNKSFTEQERKSYKPGIFANIIDSAQRICKQLAEENERWGREESSRADIDALMDANPNALADEEKARELLVHVKNLCDREPEFSQFPNVVRPGFYLLESTSHYFERLAAITRPDYLPSDEDIIRCRIKTTGTYETRIPYLGHTFNFIDVGGQRMERRKWSTQFNDVLAILFIVALSEYDQFLEEEKQTNRMRESLALFSSIINTRTFQDIPVILFLNKDDVFIKKLFASPIKKYFPAYTEGPFLEPAHLFFKDLFTSMDRNPNRSIYVHYTNATDTQNMRFLMEFIQDLILRQRLAQAGLG